MNFPSNNNEITNTEEEAFTHSHGIPISTRVLMKSSEEMAKLN